MRERLSSLLVLWAALGAAQAQAPATPAPASPPSPVMPAAPLAVSAEPVIDGSAAASQAPNGCWVCAEYLLWWIKSAPMPAPLVTTGPFDPTMLSPIPGAIGTPGTVVLFGGKDVNFGAFSGTRVTGGISLDSDGALGLEGSGFLLEHRSTSFRASGPDGNPFLAVPFRSTLDGSEHVEVITYPASPGLIGQSGGVVATSSTQLWGADGNLSTLVLNENGFRVTALAGVRYLNLDERFVFSQAFSTISPPAPGGFFFGTAATQDNFHTINEFWGGQLGARWELVGDWWALGLTTKVALGNTHQRYEVQGASLINPTGGFASFGSGGLLALPSNIGTHSRDSFSVVPEVGMNAGVNLTSWARATVGYTFLYWNNVARPGDQIDRNINPQTIPTGSMFVPGVVGPAPVPRSVQSDFWAHGLSFGLELRF